MTAGGVIIVGASHAGVQTAAALRDHGYDGRVLLVSDEPHLPYHRPPLSKTLACEGGPTLQALRPERFFADRRIEFVAETRVTEIATADSRIVTAAGQSICYDALVLATGARPILPRIAGVSMAGVLTLRGLDDAARLGEAMQAAENVVVVGAGMIGLEFAAVAVSSGRNVTVIEAGPRVLGRAVSGPTAQRLASEHLDRGVRIITNDSVAALRGDRSVREVETRGGLRLAADLVLIAVGVAADVGFAAAAGLGGPDGVHVDSRLETVAAGVYAAGDCARHPNAYAGATLRIESVQNATDQGRTVAAAIVGRGAPYAALPWFWSDQYEMKLQIAGVAQGHDLAVARTGAGGRLTVFCFRRERLVAVETIENARDHMAARRLLAAGLGVTPAQAADVDYDIGAAAKKMAAAE